MIYFIDNPAIKSCLIIAEYIMLNGFGVCKAENTILLTFRIETFIYAIHNQHLVQKNDFNFAEIR